MDSQSGHWPSIAEGSSREAEDCGYPGKGKKFLPVAGFALSRSRRGWKASRKTMGKIGDAIQEEAGYSGKRSREQGRGSHDEI